MFPEERATHSKLLTVAGLFTDNSAPLSPSSSVIHESDTPISCLTHVYVSLIDSDCRQKTTGAID